MTAPLDSPADDTAERMAQRYGTHRPRRRAVIVAFSALLATAFVVWVGWAAWLHSDPALDATVSSYRVVSEHEARAQVAVRFRNADAKGNCLVRATAADHTIVGELNLTAAQLRKAQGSWISIRTEQRATTVTLVNCTGAD